MNVPLFPEPKIYLVIPAKVLKIIFTVYMAKILLKILYDSR
jgi:hypothetical protein